MPSSIQVSVCSTKGNMSLLIHDLLGPIKSDLAQYLQHIDLLEITTKMVETSVHAPSVSRIATPASKSFPLCSAICHIIVFIGRRRGPRSMKNLAISIRPEEPAPYVSLGHHARVKGDYGIARRHLTKALTLDKIITERLQAWLRSRTRSANLSKQSPIGRTSSVSILKTNVLSWDWANPCTVAGSTMKHTMCWGLLLRKN